MNTFLVLVVLGILVVSAILWLSRRRRAIRGANEPNTKRFTGRTETHKTEDQEITMWELEDGATGQTYWTSAKPPDRPISRYFSSFDQIKEKKRANDYGGAFAIAWSSLELLPTVVDESVKEYGSWDISTIPPLDYACEHLSICRDTEKLNAVRGILLSRKELEPWLAHVDQALADVALLDNILRHISENPGTLQRSLGRALQADGRRIASLLYHAAQRRLIHRTKAGNSYNLYLSGDGAFSI
jgi:hypothetical protein